MIINKRTIGWNGNVGRSFYTTYEDFKTDNMNHVVKIKEGRAIIHDTYIEVGDIRTEVIITFKKDSDIDEFLKLINNN